MDPLAEVLNTYHQLPQYLLVVPDKDMLRHLQSGNGISIVIGVVLHHIIKQHDIAMERCKVELLAKKLGALLPDDDIPKIVWIRMLKCPNNLIEGNVFSFRGKFNSILGNRLLDGKAANHYIMSIDGRFDEFDVTGNLLLSGKHTFWCEVTTALEKFDNKSIGLRPRKYLQLNSKSTESSTSRRLPTPPKSDHDRYGSHHCSRSRSSPCKESCHRYRSDAK